MSCAPPWDDAKADALLRGHEYTELDSVLRLSLDVYRHHECVDWMAARAEEGHVVLLYHLIRNLTKGAGEGMMHTRWRVMGTREFNDMFRYFLMLTLRVVQDTCAVAIIMGQAPRQDVYELLRDKLYTWLAQQYVVSRWPDFETTLDRLESSRIAVSAHDLPLPNWIISCSVPSQALLFFSGSICFLTPDQKATEACTRTIVPLNEERQRVTATFLNLVRHVTWNGLRGISITAFLKPEAKESPAEGIEPSTTGLKVRRSDQLS